MQSWHIITISLTYLLLLFGMGLLAEHFNRKGKSLVSNPYVYALSLAVYCTAWTFYGSVERAAENGLDFLTIYLGPVLLMPLWLILLRKIIRVCKVQRITTLSDFIASRYGKTPFFGGFVAFLFIISIIPYIAIQLKAISHSFHILTGATSEAYTQPWQDAALLITAILGVFTIVFGTRKLDTTARHEGMVFVIAFESLFKLFAFLAIGIYVTYGLFNGFADIFEKAQAQPFFERLDSLSKENGVANWTWLSIASMLAFVLLPRQFQVGVKENVRERYLEQAAWLFPLYLLLINLFVLPIALGGQLLFGESAVSPSDYVLAIPLQFEARGFAVLGYLGGFSAATSMIIVSTIALSTMMSNSILMPLLVYSPFKEVSLSRNISRWLLFARRGSIILFLLLAYLYVKILDEKASLFSIGLVSFVAVAQFAPALLGGLFWKQANYWGAFTGLLIGFAVWGFTLVVPTFIEAGWLPHSLHTDGLWGYALLKPHALFGYQYLDHIQHGLFWSLMLNVFAFVFISLLTKQGVKEHNEAEVFVDIFKYSGVYENAIVWKGNARLADIRTLLGRFVGREKAATLLQDYMLQQQIPITPIVSDLRVINFTENQLAGAVGKSSARLLLASVLKEDEFSFQEVVEILRESQQLRNFNLELFEKSEALAQAKRQLTRANEELRNLDKLKDEFISTVTHEMRTPITSIRAFAEILQDMPDLEDEEREQFIETIIKESKRMERLINQVLDIEKFDSGKQQLELQDVQLNDLVRDAVHTTSQLVHEKHATCTLSLQESLPSIKADPDRIQQVLLNLLSNAIKFCAPENGRITISTYYLDGFVKVNVVNNGKGIAPEEIELIFNSFYQAKDQNYKKPLGSGLGLTISRKIVELHGGTLTAESVPNVETKFSVALPAKSFTKSKEKHGQDAKNTNR